MKYCIFCVVSVVKADTSVNSEEERMMKRWFQYDRKRLICGIILAVCAFGASVFFSAVKQGIIFSAAFILTGTLKFREDAFSEKMTGLIYGIWLVLAGIVTPFLGQLALNESFFGIGPLNMFLEVIISVFLILILVTITLRPRVSAHLVMIGVIIFSMVNYYVFRFRGSELAPSDIFSYQTAMNVVSEYHISVELTMVYAIIIAALWIFLSYALPSYRYTGILRPRVISLGTGALLVLLFFVLSRDLKSLHWINTGSVRNGYILNFVLELNEQFVRKPGGYTPETAKKVYETLTAEQESDQRNPDILVIMDESFADLGKLGDGLNTNIDIMPFFDSLKEDTVKGYTLSSVFGGGTPNSEFEFLTGNTYSFLPYGSIAYQQYVSTDVFSIVGDMKDRGYRTIGMHPYLASSWMRNTIYPYLNFDEQYFLDDFPGEDLIRSYISDQEMFDYMISLYEDHTAKSEKPVFMFGVTMQNHGGYEYDADDFVSDVKLSGYSKDYPEVEQYLSVIHKTDEAIEKLIGYFENADRDTVIVFFGDHYPKLDPAFFEEVHGGQFTTLDEKMLQYEVPFFIWSNYDSKEQTVELTSLNYLSEYMFNTCGMSLPPYLQYLKEIQKDIPAINSMGYYSEEDQCFHTTEEADGDEKELLNEYRQLQYNNLFDPDNRNTQLFPSYDETAGKN